MTPFIAEKTSFKLGRFARSHNKKIPTTSMVPAKLLEQYMQKLEETN